jgi:hypothetical protein
MRTAMMSKKRVIVVWMPFTVVSRSSLMSLIITFMFEPAKLQMNWASARGTSNLRWARVSFPMAGPLVMAQHGIAANCPWHMLGA